MFFYGQWDCRVESSRGRVKVPVTFKEELGKETVIVEDIDSADPLILVYPKKKSILKKFDPSRIWLVKVDKGGRILIPKKLRFSFIGKKVTWFGKGDHFEIKL